jgi:KDO2-lipid IV(A) lauroyltransferase
MSSQSDSFRTRLLSKLAVGLIYLIGSLPISLNRTLGTFLGWLMILLPNDNRHATRINLKLCFPQLSEQERKQLEKVTLIEGGRGATEFAYVWRKPHQTLAMVKSVKGDDLLAAAMQSGRPVVVLAPHHGCWELMNYWLSSHYDMHILFMPSGLPDVDRLIQRSRETFRTTAYPITPEGVISFNRSLQGGHVITGVLPDQVALRGRGMFVNFFGHPAYTSPHPCRLIQKHNAIAFVVGAHRRTREHGYDLFIEPVDEAIYNENLDVALASMHRDIEKFILTAPEQYLWSYKRFRRTPDGQSNPYQ